MACGIKLNIHDAISGATTIRTTTGITSNYITRLYPLELSVDNRVRKLRSTLQYGDVFNGDA